MTYRVRRDGTISYGFHNPDGNWVEVPAPDDEPRTWITPTQESSLPVTQPSAPGCVEFPTPGEPQPARSAPAPEISPLQVTPSTLRDVHQFLREMGRRGGQARAARHSRDEIATWGRVRRKTKSRGMH
jgi:hypothetical protein